MTAKPKPVDPSGRNAGVSHQKTLGIEGFSYLLPQPPQNTDEPAIVDRKEKDSGGKTKSASPSNMDKVFEPPKSISESHNEAAQTGKQSYVQPSRIGKKRLALYLESSLANDLRALAYEKRVSVHQLIELALENTVEKNKDAIAGAHARLSRPPTL